MPQQSLLSLELKESISEDNASLYEKLVCWRSLEARLHDYGRDYTELGFLVSVGTEGFRNAEVYHKHLITSTLPLRVAVKNHEVRVARRDLHPQG